MARYAEGTTVTVEKSKADIEQIIRRYKARKVATGFDEDTGMSVIQFEMHDRRVFFRLVVPPWTDDQFLRDGRGQRRKDPQRQTAHAAEERRLWRSLFMVIKAKLESVDSGIESFEEAFLPQIIVPGTGGMTYGSFAIPQIEQAYDTGELPPMLPGISTSVLALGSGRRVQA